MTKSGRPIGVVALIAFHIFSTVIWFFGQTLAVFYFDMVAEWGLQEPRALVDPVIVEVNRAIGLVDTILMLPLLVVAAIGLIGMRFYGAVASWVVFGITLYWPSIWWASQFFYARTGITHAPMTMSGILIPGAAWIIAAWGIWYLYRNRALFD
ncbi:hypothetical protein [uncultured Tateyamaria sp.]|uniref:hypothetical protein n=1 Tax=uncultured Tateyamaria sp. TaxID=455651 RepID=UPI0026094CA3|nr:hypothetical protein [uncultured Tateyamaria sp.]